VARLSGTGRLADDLYLLAHHEVSGRPHLQPRAAGLGLAGALLAELMLSGSIYLGPDRIAVTDRSPPDDGLARSVLGLVASEAGQQRRGTGCCSWHAPQPRMWPCGWSSRDT
jgi:hypothetical protein